MDSGAPAGYSRVCLFLIKVTHVWSQELRRIQRIGFGNHLKEIKLLSTFNYGKSDPEKQKRMSEQTDLLASSEALHAAPGTALLLVVFDSHFVLC